ncbi:MAG: SDR family oxidoreductase [Oscillospiraceae bacterium]
MSTQEKARTATLVVGADSDMGAAIIAGLTGEIVAHFCIYPQKLASLCGEGRNVTPVKGDLSTESGILEFIENVKATGFAINKIVHLPSAAARQARFRDFDLSHFEREQSIALNSALLICRAFVPEMAKARFGRVVFMLTSYCIGVPPKFLTSYIVCKYALEGLMKSLAAEYSDKGITVNGVAPSMTETKFLSDMSDLIVGQAAKSNPTGRNACPADIAPAFWLLLGDDNEFISGAVIPVTGGSAF